jgi:hypothetical protein
MSIVVSQSFSWYGWDMKHLLSSALLMSFLLVTLNLGSFDVAAAASMSGVHTEDMAAGMHAMYADENGARIDAPLPVCGMDFLCYIACQGVGGITTITGANENSFGKKLVSVCGLDESEPYTGVVTDTSQTDFSPPDDPGRLLTLLKRE